MRIKFKWKNVETQNGWLWKNKKNCISFLYVVWLIKNY